MAKELIYTVEDEKHIQQLIEYNLKASDYRVSAFDDGESMLDECKNTVPDLFMLDIMLPGMDGIEVCKRLRENPQTKNIPIIMLTARSEEFDKVLGLELGADDYITKPFSIRELNARVKALFRRINNAAPEKAEVIKYADIIIDCSRHEAYKAGKLIDLPYKEFELLKILMQNKGRVLSRELLLEKIWGYEYYGETRTVDVHIRYLRQKIEVDDTKPVYIETVRGIGYKLSDRDEK